MSWSSPTTAGVLAQFSPDEQTLIETIQGSTAHLATILAATVAEARGAVRSGNYPLADSGLPDSLHQAAYDLARWRWLIALSSLPQLQTDARKAAASAAQDLLKRVAAGQFAVEPPASSTVVRSGSWNSRAKIIPRSHPIPAPSSQSPNNSGYANPDGPADS